MPHPLLTGRVRRVELLVSVVYIAVEGDFFCTYDWNGGLIIVVLVDNHLKSKTAFDQYYTRQPVILQLLS